MLILLSVLCFAIALWGLTIIGYLIYYLRKEVKKVEFFINPTYMDDEDTFIFTKKQKRK
jgi:hypothetical protein